VALPLLQPGRAGGGESATRALLEGLDDIDTGSVAITVVGSPENRGWLEGIGLRRLRTEIADDPWLRVRIPRGFRLATTSVARTSLARKLDDCFDLVHFPLLPMFPLRKARSVVTVWDVNHKDHPRAYGVPVRVFRRIAYDPAAKRANHVLAPTCFTAERLRETLGLDSSRLEVVAPGVLDRTWLGPREHTPLSSNLGFAPPYFFYPASWWPHKNHARLIASFARVAEDQDVSLVLTGGPPSARARANELASRLGISRSVHHLGVVTDSLIRSLHAHASAVVYPSLYEGFGIPPLESMAVGTPVLAGDIPAVREVVGEAALLVPPTSERAMSIGMRRLLVDEELRRHLVSAGKTRAERFSAAAGGHRHVAVYRRLAIGR
jgi:glycosyltransferase involved in cell wall biosynthesis